MKASELGVLVLFVFGVLFFMSGGLFSVFGTAPHDSPFQCSDINFVKNTPNTCSLIRDNYGETNGFREEFQRYSTWSGIFSVWPNDLSGCNPPHQTIEVTITTPDFYKVDEDLWRIPRIIVYEEPGISFTASGYVHTRNAWDGLSGEQQLLNFQYVFNDYAKGTYTADVKWFDCNGAVMEEKQYTHYFGARPPEVAFNPELPYDVDCEAGTLVQYWSEYDKAYYYSLDPSPNTLLVSSEQWRSLCPASPPPFPDPIAWLKSAFESFLSWLCGILPDFIC